MTEGLFINIEGPDASGKETQWRKLVNELQERGHDVYAQDFPAYTRTAAGKELYEYLHGDEDRPLREEARLFMKDRRALKDEIASALENGQIVVTDRYAQSNWAYQTTDMSTEDRWAFIEWMKEAEQDLPQPDVTLYIDMPVEQSLELMAGRDQARDRNENREKLEKVVSAYREIADRENWEIIKPMTPRWYDVSDNERPSINGTAYLRSPENIYDDGNEEDRNSVWQTVKPYLPEH